MTVMTQAPSAESTPTDKKSLPPLSIMDIMQCIPHRYPFLLVDGVTEHYLGHSIKGFKNITMNEPYFQGHFPNRPIMPGVLQVEALAQLGGILISHIPEGKGKLAVFSGITNVKFRRMVLPGDRLDLECELIRFRPPIGKSLCKASVNGEVAVEGELMFSLVDNLV
ncbi:MAG: 3-hydroxyacyl-ACP dehydratase FabZ [Vampirovibrionales bacterium]|nr:3-hydroxyacyl-ACP dehydratase FabZ [Vampirovibrionales bacterium]